MLVDWQPLPNLGPELWRWVVLPWLWLRAGFNRNRYSVITRADYSYSGRWPVSTVNGYGLGSHDGGYDRRLIEQVYRKTQVWSVRLSLEDCSSTSNPIVQPRRPSPPCSTPFPHQYSPTQRVHTSPHLTRYTQTILLGVNVASSISPQTPIGMVDNSVKIASLTMLTRKCW